ncbi:indole-3-glycerol-phosphate synthase [Candidatus Micrarchaeota archaeon]|nr:indole-3-glycerol-phosphate synthase [Candidatus Micrarchaeota archaeon]
MADILDKFIAEAKESIASGYYDAPVRARVRKISFSKALLKNFALIAELKRASPAGDYSLTGVDVEKTARLFEENGAGAVSVVVAQKSFKGNVSDVTAVKKTVGLPVLFKDFVLDFKQVDCASAVGADAVLLIQSVMDRRNLDVGEFIEYAHSKGLEVLLECYTSSEFSRALKTKADSLGVNNRDLQTLKVDFAQTKKIMGSVDEKLLAGRPRVSESGVKTREDSQFVKNLGINAVLVGTALWKTDNQAMKIRELALK